MTQNWYQPLLNNMFVFGYFFSPPLKDIQVLPIKISMIDAIHRFRSGNVLTEETIFSQYRLNLFPASVVYSCVSFFDFPAAVRKTCRTAVFSQGVGCLELSLTHADRACLNYRPSHRSDQTFAVGLSVRVSIDIYLLDRVRVIRCFCCAGL